MGSLDEDQKLISFLEALGEDTDVDFAKQMLVEHNWDLEAALTTVTGGDIAPPGSAGTPAAGFDAVDEEGYRAPMRTGYRETLIGPEPHELAWQHAADAAARAGHIWHPDGQGATSGDEGVTDVQRAIQASAAEYSRVADQNEQGAIAQAIEASYGAHLTEEQHRFASATAAEREEQEMIARAIEASYKEQSLQDARYRTEIEQASAASLCPAQDGGARPGIKNSGCGSHPASGVGPTAAARASANMGIRQPVPAPLPVPRTVSAGNGLHAPPFERRGLTSRSPATDAAPVSTNRVPMPAPRSTNASSSAMNSLPRRSTRPLDGASGMPAHTGAPASGSQSSPPTRSQANVPPHAARARQTDRALTTSAGPLSANSGPPRPPGQVPITPPKPDGGAVVAASGLPSSRSRSPMGAPPISRPRPALPGARPDPPEPIRRAPPRLSDGLRPPETGGAPGQSAAMREAAEAERRWRDADRDVGDPVGYASRSSALLAQRRQANEQERERRAAQEAERQRREAEEAERQREERRAAEASAERERRRAAEETERRRRLEEEACRQAEAERRRRKEEEEAARQRAAETAAEEERRRTAAAAAAAAEQEAERARRAQEQARRVDEAERRRREEETAKRQKQEADAAEQEAKRLAAREAEELRKEREDAEARQREAERAAQPEEKEKEVNEVVQALVALRRNYKDKDPKGLLTCLQTLRAYINNLAKNPQEPKFQRINCDNAAFRTRVASFEGAVNVLCACGFKESEGALAVDPSFLKSKGPRLWDALAKVDVMVDQVKGASRA